MIYFYDEYKGKMNNTTGWQKEEEEYLGILSDVCIDISNRFQDIYFLRKKTMTKIKVPAIMIGSLTGVASFGSTNFPKDVQRWVAIVVGVLNICVATLNTLEGFLKVNEEMTSAKATSQQLRKLAEDIEKELIVPSNNRPTLGSQFLRDAYTRYQQIMSHAPMLEEYIPFVDTDIIKPSHKSLFKKTNRDFETSVVLNIGNNANDIQSCKKRLCDVATYIAKTQTVSTAFVDTPKEDNQNNTIII